MRERAGNRRKAGAPARARRGATRRPAVVKVAPLAELEWDALPPLGTVLYELETGGRTYVVASFPPALAALLERCTRAERDIVPDLLAGRTNAEIARRRRRSVRTIANQVASVLRRLGVRSRRELAALVGAGGREA